MTRPSPRACDWDHIPLWTHQACQSFAARYFYAVATGMPALDADAYDLFMG